MFSQNSLHKNRRLWNDTEKIINDTVSGILLLHQNLVFIDSCKTVVRQDLDKLNGKVKIIGGGSVVEGLMYAGFVGPGMLTGAVLGLHQSLSYTPSSDSILEAINHVVLSDQEKAAGVLLLVHDCPEFYLNFYEAKTNAESNGISVKMVLVRDEVSEKLNQKPVSSPRSPSGLLLLYKIVGAMAEEGSNLDEIFNACHEIIRNKSIFSTAVYVMESYDEPAQIQITRGDVISDRDKKNFTIENSSTNEIIKYVIDDLINCQEFTPGSKLAIILDYFNGFSELEANIVIKELVGQLNSLRFKVRILYCGSFHVSVELKGFHVSFLNMCNLKYLYYLNVPTSAYAWPKTNSRQILLKLPSNNANQEKSNKRKPENESHPKVDTKVSTDVNLQETYVLLTAIHYACEALIACFMKIDMLDIPDIPPEVERCGTRLAFTADLIKTEIRKNKFAGMSSSHILFNIAYIFDYYRTDAQAELYKLFLSTVGKELMNKNNLDTDDWVNAFVKATSSIGQIIQGSKFFDALDAARIAFCDAYGKNVDVIEALGQAVHAAQILTSRIILESGEIPSHLINATDYGFIELAGAHAVGVWMRGAYEGIKLVYASKQFVQRKGLNNMESEGAASKRHRYEYD
ncbi:triokinase/FMN cyclase-like [Copidosoma floridanum]|uniref:triokinase/FMN cyclase-like n=1 Tax=Copidosoma floridanum TaxID=29053 RepID=UPI0006C94EFE|nr:triokinase/FMN cyclase-like [Copidosoma floridanum]